MFRWLVVLCCLPVAGQPLPGTAPLELQGDLSLQMVEGIHKYLDGYERPAGSSDRARLAYILGVEEERAKPALEWVASAARSPVVARGRGYSVREVRWPVFRDVWGEGLLYEPVGRPVMRVVAIGDADDPPEKNPFAQRLADNGALVVVPLLMDRSDTYSGAQGYRMTNMPHREFLQRLAYPLGRHIIGMEVQKIRAAVDWFSLQDPKLPIGVAGYGEGGLIALHTAALDERIDRALVSGHFTSRREVWKEPVYRDVWGLLPNFGDAELADLVAPRKLIVEAAPGPSVAGPPPPTSDRRGGAPGRLAPVSFEQVQAEVNRVAGQKPLVVEAEGAGSEKALAALLGVSRLRGGGPVLQFMREADPGRLERQFRQLFDYTQRVAKESLDKRAMFWSPGDRSSADHWVASVKKQRDRLWDDLIGRLPQPSVAANPRTRLIFDEPKFRGYEVVLDVWPGVFAYGYLLVPKDIRRGEKRAVVVCQHGLEGRPRDVADPKLPNATYNQFAVRLAEQGFITFSPQNAYIGGELFRTAQRKAHPWQLTIFSFITGQHQRILEWLGGLEFVDAKRIGFYGLSYGGFSALRIPALLDGYALSICSGNFNEWVWKTATLDAPFVYGLTHEYEATEFNLAHLANHFELATLIFPRPFMVERGHKDGVSWDEWVAYEYAKVQRFYTQMGMRERTEIEYFDGGHVIHGVGTFDFLKRFLGEGLR